LISYQYWTNERKISGDMEEPEESLMYRNNIIGYKKVLGMRKIVVNGIVSKQEWSLRHLKERYP
jgi:hypothetical protein